MVCPDNVSVSILTCLMLFKGMSMKSCPGRPTGAATVAGGAPGEMPARSAALIWPSGPLPLTCCNMHNLNPFLIFSGCTFHKHVVKRLYSKANPSANIFNRSSLVHYKTLIPKIFSYSTQEFLPALWKISHHHFLFHKSRLL